MSDAQDITADLLPQLLYRVDGGQARFATWGLIDGHEALAVFTAQDAADRYRAELAEPTAWTIFQPPRDQLIEILVACRGAGIFYAALNPLGGNARSLFDIPQVLAAVGIS